MEQPMIAVEHLRKEYGTSRGPVQRAIRQGRRSIAPFQIARASS